MTSKSQKNQGYLLPYNLEPTEYVCLSLLVPNEDQYIRAIRGAIQELGYWWNWEKTYLEGDTRAKTAGEVWRKTIYESLQIGECEVSCCGEIDQLSETIIQLNQSYTNENNANTINNYGVLIDNYNGAVDPVVTIAPSLVSPSTLGNRALCSAISELIEITIQTERKRREQEALVIGIVSIALGIASALATAGTSLAMGLAVGGGATALGGILYAGVTDAVLSDQFAINEVKCLMYQRLANVKPTKTAFETSLDPTTGLSTNADLIRSVLTTYLNDTGYHASFLEKIEEGYRLAELGLIGDCSVCPDTWEVILDMTEQDHGFIPAPYNGYNCATYVIGVGWQSAYFRDPFSARGLRGAWIAYNFPAPTNILEIEAIFSKTNGQTGIPAATSYIRTNIEGTLLTSKAWVTATSPLLFVGNVFLNQFSILVRCGIRTTNVVTDPGGQATITSVRVRGKGVNPWA